MPNDSREKPEIKVTDKRIFTAEGEIREEFRGEIHPSDPVVTRAAETAQAETPPPVEKKPAPKPAAERRSQSAGAPADTSERRRTMADQAASPGTPFSNFIEPLIAQAYISLGMMRNPYQPQSAVDAPAARQMIDILSLLQEKTAGNLTPDEDELLRTHLGQLKLAYVQVTKNLS